MKLVKVIIDNFRSFGPSKTTIDFEDMTAVIGANSSGKTALMIALVKMFGDTGIEVKREDFHLAKGVNPEDINTNYFNIEAIFTFPELEEEGDNYVVPLFFQRLVVDSPGAPPYIRILLEATWKRSNNPEGLIDYSYSYITLPENEAFSDENKISMNKYDRSHIKVLYVPAVREPSSQLRNASGTILWRTLNGINWTEQDKKDIQDKINMVDETFSSKPGISLVQTAIKTQWKLYHDENRYNSALIKFNSTDMDNILKKIEVQFSPTETENTYNVSALGDGLKSLFYLSMVDSLLEIESEAIKERLTETDESKRILNIVPPALTIIIIEEPENHISPHLLGKVVENLNRIAGRENSQTIITSHNSSIVKRIEPTNIRHVRMCNVTQTSIVNNIILPEQVNEEYKYIKEAVKAYPELYFSSLVVLGEGDSEEILLPKIFELTGYGLDYSGISVVPLGGRHVNHFWKLLKQLEIPFITLLDLDRERQGGAWGRIKYVINQLSSIGFNKEDLLKLNEEVSLSEIELKLLHKKEITTANLSQLNEWIEKLEKYNVYFSNPLDIDFLMLESFKSEYLSIINNNEGPRIVGIGKISDLTDEQKQLTEFSQRIIEDIRKTLKPEGGNGATYTNEQKELMIWYSYLFLGRGKPSTHIMALTKINDEAFLDKLPSVLRRIINKSIMLKGNLRLEEGGE
jgi:putative ATP-dependent endonuclease of the OLD family